MGNVTWRLAAALGVGLAGCDYFQGPKMAVPTKTTRPVQAGGPNAPAVQKVSKARYMGKSPEDWGKVLTSTDLDTVREATTALRILGADGRHYLIQGLDSTVPETRRLCLDNLTVNDLRCYGDEGRKLLVKLAGDRADLRIRERATTFLAEWDRALPAP